MSKLVCCSYVDQDIPMQFHPEKEVFEGKEKNPFFYYFLGA